MRHIKRVALIYPLGLLLAQASSMPVCAQSATQEHVQSVSTTAADNGLRPSYQKCLNGTGGVTSSMNDCIGVEYTYQDARLNKAYKSLMAKLGKQGQNKLRADERIWIAYRNSHCTADADGGSAAELASNGCSVEETAKQAATLENRIYIQSLK